MEYSIIIVMLMWLVGYAIGLAVQQKKAVSHEVTVWFPDVKDSNEDGESNGAV